MDPLAHTLVGATLAESGLKRWTRLATPTLLIGANLPDIDAVAMAFDGDTSLYVRRGLTHGVLAMAVMPPIAAAIVLAADRALAKIRGHSPERPQLGRMVVLMYLATLTHPVLDWMNTYGVRLLMPFSSEWFYGDAFFIVDPWLWLLMAAAVVAARTRSGASLTAFIVLAIATTALVTGVDRVPLVAKAVWIGGVGAIVGLRFRLADGATAARVARLCLGLLGCYMTLAVTGSVIAEGQARRFIEARGRAVKDVMAGPLPANPLVRDVIVVTHEGYEFLVVDWLASPMIRFSAPSMSGDLRGPMVTAALEAPSVRGLRTWMRYPSYRVERTEHGYRVEIRDVRYSRRDSQLGSAVVDLDHALRPIN